MNDLRRPWPPKSFLGRLSEQTRDNLLALCRQVRYDGDFTLLAQGDRNRHAILIFDGAVKVQLIDSRGYETLLAVRQRGEMLGELAALSGEPRTASVIAVGVVRAGVVSGPVLEDFLACHPDAAREMIRTQGERLSWANRRRVDFAARSAASKLAHVLTDLASDFDDQNDVIQVDLSQFDLASVVGIALNTAQGGLRSLSDAGLIERGYRSVTILDLPGLRAFAESDRRNP